MGHVQKRDHGKWRARYRDPAGNERSKTFTTQRDARAWVSEVEHQLATGDWVDRRQSRRTVEQWSVEWLATSPNIGPKTRVGYESILKHHVLPHLGSWPVGAVDRGSIKRWVADLTGAGVSASRVRSAVTVLRGALDTAVDAGALGANPAVRLKLPRASRQEMLFIDADQVAELAATIEPPYGLVVNMAAYTGMRAGELWALEVRNVDLLNRRVRVMSSVSDVNGKRLVTETKTHSERTVPLPKFLADQIAVHLEGHTHETLFVSPAGAPVRHGNFYRRAFRPAVLAAPSVPDDLRFHDLRHTCAALLISLGAHPRALMEWLGHSTVTVSLDRYGHLMPGLTERLSEGLNDLFEKLPRPERGLSGSDSTRNHARNGL